METRCLGRRRRLANQRSRGLSLGLAKSRTIRTSMSVRSCTLTISNQYRVNHRSASLLLGKRPLLSREHPCARNPRLDCRPRKTTTRCQVTRRLLNARLRRSQTSYNCKSRINQCCRLRSRKRTSRSNEFTKTKSNA